MERLAGGALVLLLITACGGGVSPPSALDSAQLRRVAEAAELSHLDEETRAALVRGNSEQLFHIFLIDGEDVTYRQWNGILLLPTATELGDLRPTRFTYGDRSMLQHWYHQPDGSISLSLLDASDTHFGVFTIDTAAGATFSVDLNDDALVDFIARMDGSNVLTFMAAEDAGLVYLNNLLAGRDNECQGAARNSFMPLGSLGCNSPGVSSGLIGSKEGFGDQACATQTNPRLPRGTEGVMENPLSTAWNWYSNLPAGVRGGASVAWQLVLHLVFPPTAGDSGYNPETGEWRPLVKDRETGDWREATDEEIEELERQEDDDEDAGTSEESADDSADDADGTGGSGEGDTSQPHFGEEPTYEEVMADLCTRRAEAQGRWDSLVSLLQAGCDNLYVGRTPTQPGPDDAPMPDFKCEDQGTELSALGLLESVRETGADGCGPLAQPDAEGNCPGRRGFVGGAGGDIYIDFLPGMLLVEACDPRVCDPRGDVALRDHLRGS